MSTTTANQALTAPATTASGDFVWYELRTKDAQAATAFYCHVVGWEAKGSGDPGGLPYTLLSAAGRDVTGLMQITPDMQSGGMQPAWVGFIGVDHVDRYAERVTQAGGKLHSPPQDIPGIGRFASVEDPQGASFLLFKGSRDQAPPPLPMGTPGSVGWHELAANEGDAAWAFYSSLFGWHQESVMDMGPMGLYRIFDHGGPQLGAVMTRDPARSSGPSWLYYFFVDDIDAAAARIAEKGGQICMGPHEVPGPLWIVIAIDPQGATFAIAGPRIN